MNKNILLIVTIIISLIFMNIGSIFFDIHNNLPCEYNEPIYWPLAIGFSSLGGIILVRLILYKIIPTDIWKNINNIKQL